MATYLKLFCRDYKTAQKIYNATRVWLKERLDLDISPDKSKITNLRRNYTEFLGFKLMVKPKRNKYVCQSKMCDKARKNTINKLKEQIKKIRKSNNSKEVLKLNSMILGSHHYYNSATNASLDFKEINFLVTKTLEIRLRSLISHKPIFTKTYKKLYGSYNGKFRTVYNVTIFPIYACKCKILRGFLQEICNYTEKGRLAIHSKVRGCNHLIRYLLRNTSASQSVEFNDNRISLIIGQKGKCYITGLDLEVGNMECHRKQQKSDGGSDEYDNLVWLCGEAHKLVHCKEQDTISKYLGILSLDEKGIKNVNSLRKLVGNSVI